MYREFKSLNLPEIDREILAFWEEQRIFQKSVEQRPADNSFVFYEGPPSANGMPGIHHVIARAIKDIFCRYQTMNGKRVDRKGGWDTHGLPIELAVEKELGITKEDIGVKISIEEYNRRCRETVMRYKDHWDDLTRKIGYWVDLDHPYITFKNEYIESVWWLLHRLYEKGLLYKGYTIQPYSPAAGTGLSTHELNQPGAYKEVSDTTIVAMFKVVRSSSSEHLFDSPDEDVRILAWTTTPWTLLSNTALTIGGNISYAKVKTHDPYTHAPVSVVLAEALVGNWLGGEKKPEIIEQRNGIAASQLEGIRYEQLFPYGNPIELLNGNDDAFRVLVGDFVTTEDGTGVVHTAPSFGADDMRAAKANGIGTLTLVDKQGKFKDGVGNYSGRYVKNYKDDPDWRNPDVDIAIQLKTEGKALNVAKYAHNYPHCWRTDKPILYYPLDSWFVRTTACKDRLIELNQTINWKPEATGSGRFGNWLENLQDWNLSRSRYWGIPLPIWRSADGSEEICIGSLEQLATEIEKANAALGLSQTLPPDLHRPWIDYIQLVSPTGQPMTRELDLIDVWFDSGSMPVAQWHYPFENQEAWATSRVADFISEGVDQTRGWFYTLHAIAGMCFDSVAFKNVLSTGLVLDKNGQKMSKRLGNTVDPFATIATYGADPTRWYMVANVNPWENLKFDIAGIQEVRNQFFGTLYNTYAFFALYANVDGFSMDEQNVFPYSRRPELDRWILSKLYSLVAEVRTAYEEYEPTRACRAIEVFVDEHLSNWYVRLSRRRFWRGEMSDDKLSAYQTLFECLMVASQLAAPVAPFFTDWLYRNLTAPIRKKAIEKNTPLRHESVHLSDLIQPEPWQIDPELEKRMDYAQRISSLLLSLRKKEKIRVRQPLQRVLLPVLDADFQKQVDAVAELIRAEVNVKNIEYVSDTSGLIKKGIKPNFKTLGRRLGKDMKDAAAAIAAFSQEDIAAIERNNTRALTLNGNPYDLTLEDFEISSEDIPGWLVATDGYLTVALDTTLTPELVAEGTARELVNRIQNLRKSNDFQVTDKISVRIEKHPAVAEAIQKFADYIKSETLATSVVLTDGFNGERVELFEDLALGIEVSLN